MICFDTTGCRNNECDKCQLRLLAIDLILNVPGHKWRDAIAKFFASNPSLEYPGRQAIEDYTLSEDVYQRHEYEITGKCSVGCSRDLLHDNPKGDGQVCKLTGRPCDSQRLSGIVNAYSILNASTPQPKTQ